MKAALEGKKKEMAAEAGVFFRRSALPTFKLLLLLRSSV
jgi:hypothetical protein